LIESPGSAAIAARMAVRHGNSGTASTLASCAVVELKTSRGSKIKNLTQFRYLT
jgi:hypothetical protein